MIVLIFNIQCVSIFTVSFFFNLHQLSGSFSLFIYIFLKITFKKKPNFYDFVFCDQEKPIGDKRGTFWKFMSLGEKIIEPFYRDPGHSEGDFFSILLSAILTHCHFYHTFYGEVLSRV